MKDLELWLIRHGQTNWNAERRIQGQTDIPLNAVGRHQAGALAGRIGQESFDKVYASDLSRALETAKEVFPGEDICLDERLREIHFGLLEGKTTADMTPEEARHQQARLADPDHYAPPGGETRLELSSRVKNWLANLPEKGRVIAFSHGGTIRAAVYSVTGQPEGFRWHVRLGNTSITVLHLGEDNRSIFRLNDTAHLETLNAL